MKGAEEEKRTNWGEGTVWEKGKSLLHKEREAAGCSIWKWTPHLGQTNDEEEEEEGAQKEDHDLQSAYEHENEHMTFMHYKDW